MSKTITDALATAAVQRLQGEAKSLNFSGNRVTSYIQAGLKAELPDLQALSLLAHGLSDQLDPAKIQAQLEADKAAAAKSDAIARAKSQAVTDRMTALADNMVKADAAKVAQGVTAQPQFGTPRPAFPVLP